MPVGARHAQSKAYTDTAAEFDDPLQPGQQYVINATTDCWYRLTTTGGTAAVAAADDNILLKSGEQHPIKSPDDGTTTTNSYVSVIRASANGTACIRLIEGV